jgi:uncharacterized membrane protein
MFQRILIIWLQFRFTVFLLTLAGFILLGYHTLGPFLVSPEFQWLKELQDKTPLIGLLLDIEGMLIEKLIATTVPLFTVWSLIMFYYAYNSKAEIHIEQMSPFLSVFTSGTGTFIAALGGITVGICAFGILNFGLRPPVYGLTIIAAALVFGGAYLRGAAKPRIQARDWLHRRSREFAWLFLIMALIAYIYGIVIEPYEKWNLIQTAYNSVKPS